LVAFSEYMNFTTCLLSKGFFSSIKIITNTNEQKCIFIMF
jgi:hypothetical protein